MKTLLLLLLIPVALWSQLLKLPIPKQISDTIVLTNDYNLAWEIDITAGMLFEYEKECYNDSTKNIIGKGNVTCYPVSPPIFKYESYDTLYTHRQPTFDGFIQWLHKKYKL